jgi:hypothetical protein
MAKLVTDQLTRFVTLNPYQLAGHVENLDFWLTQVRHARATLDGYGVRFVRLHDAQERFVVQQGITVSVVDPAGVIQRPPPAPRRIPDREIRQARRSLVEATRRFLERCQNEGLIAESVVTAVMAEFAE